MIAITLPGIDSFTTWLQFQGAQIAWKLLGSAAIFFVGYWIAGKLLRLLRALCTRRGLDPMIAGFACNTARGGILAMLGIAALQNLGISTASFVAVLGAVGLALSLAMQNSLQNFAAGVLLLVLRPFRQGDFIEAAGTSGIVDRIEMFHTLLTTPDNKRVIVPNAKINGDLIINHTALPNRRVDLAFAFAYSNEIPRIRELLLQVAREDDRVMREPEPSVVVGTLNENHVQLLLRFWVARESVAVVQAALLESAKEVLDREKIARPPGVNLLR